MDKFLEIFANLFQKLPNFGKTITFILVIVVISWIDSQMGFTYHYFISRKIEEIDKISHTIKDSSLDNTTRNLLQNERLVVINKGRGFIEPYERHYKPKGFFFYISSLWVWFLAILAVLFNSQGQIISKRGQLLGVLIIIAGLASITLLIAWAISPYFQQAFLYIFNALIQLVILIGISYLAKSKI